MTRPSAYDAADEPGESEGSESEAASLAGLVVLALDRLEREGDPALEALCVAHPDLADALRARIARLRAVGFAGSSDDARPLPERVGGFRILGRLGGGGMGVVLRAEQEGLRREVALKLVRPDLLHFPGARERFRREIAAVARLAHPGIVPVYAGGEDGGIPFCA
ncbi:MAG: hypothetical protein H6825_16295, partial [Planctomycetes bacterium]|nr:hypothetical protein [Planctomycetota bacterium]